MQNIDSPFVKHWPSFDEVGQRGSIADSVHIVLVVSLGKCRTTAIPDHSVWIDSWNEKGEDILTDIVRQVTVCFVYAISRSEMVGPREGVQLLPAEVIKISKLTEGPRLIAVLKVCG